MKSKNRKDTFATTTANEFCAKRRKRDTGKKGSVQNNVQDGNPNAGQQTHTVDESCAECKHLTPRV